MKKIIVILVCMLFVVINLNATEKNMSVIDYALRLATELNIEVENTESTYADVTSLFPEAIQDIFNTYGEKDLVTRKLATDIFAYFLDENELEALILAGDESDYLLTEDIDNLFSKSAREGEILTYITPPGHSFTNRLDTKINELYQPVGEDESGY